MNPHKMNKVDISSMSEQDQKAFKMYGKMPAKNLLTKMQKDRKYFDSGDYMMNKAGVGNQPLGTAIPTPEGVPHASPPGPNSPSGILSSSPTNTVPFPAAGVSAQLNNVQSEETHVHAQTIPGQATHPSPTHRGSVGVGISPAATSEAMEVPQNAHGRRSSESHHGARISPPGTTRDGGNPSSSFPIQHPGAFGSSPVKASSLARRLDEEMEQ